MKSVSIIIPNWNGKELLERNLPPLLKALKLFQGKWEVIIVDDGSTDGSPEFIEKGYPDIRLIRLNENRGFATACNQGARAAKYDTIYLLNNDVVVNEGFLEPLLRHFEKEDIFAISSMEIGKNFNSLPLVRFKFGIFWCWYQPLQRRLKEAVPVFCVSGGHTLYDKEKFLKLGGFDELFNPFYGEDGDICWRAWRRGWKSLYEPVSQVRHYWQSTIGKYYSQREIQIIHWRNRFLLTWKNLTSKRLLFRHFFFLPFELIISVLTGKKYFALGFFAALRKLKKVVKRRQKIDLQNFILSDREFFRKFSRFKNSNG